MKRIFTIIALPVLFTSLLVGRPPRYAGSFPYRLPLDTPRKVPIYDTIELADRMDSLYKKTVLLNEKTGEARQGSADLERDTRRLLQQVSKARDTALPSVIVLLATDTVYKPQKPILVRDTSLDKRTWFGKFFATNKRLMKDCKLRQKLRRIVKH